MNTLPALPGSDTSAIQRNHYDGFYRVGARDFWKDAKLSSEIVKPFVTCEHYLIQKGQEAQCASCHVGWNLPHMWRVLDGKLFDGEARLQFAQ